ncbi:hypothetical protein SeSA_A0672 [Salmonella enterica subsp. enterica serovar Schwarzengrund str. CVM19633]|uniref:Uncharacterized protein n=1 Tax=Salmonella schwarzengrund (strain CVM19633) TaxID=439843 RepID=A0A0N1QUD0_SALSV|nr:hypothetical protein SeSA_A0672 [Salmonella enterica subsp. enterica serovar Schwarzengrund str. CVM19633]
MATLFKLNDNATSEIRGDMKVYIQNRTCSFHQHQFCKLPGITVGTATQTAKSLF